MLRLPSVFFGVLSVAGIYRLGRELCNNEVGLLGAFLLTISPLHLRHSQEARMYIVLMLFVIMSSYFFWRAWRKGGRGNWMAYVIFSALSLYTHYLAAFLLLSHNLFVAISFVSRYCTGNYRKSGLLYWVLSQLSILLLLAPRLPSILPRYQQGVGGMSAAVFGGRPNIRTPLNVFITFSLGPGVWSLLPTLLRRSIYALIGICFVLAIFSAIRKDGRKLPALSSSAPAVFTLTCLVIPIALTLGALWWYERKYDLRYVVAFLPFFYLMISKGVLALPKASLRILAVVMLVSVSALGLNQEYTHNYKEDWRGATQHIVNHWQKGDALCFVPVWDNVGFLYYAGTEFASAIQPPPSVQDIERRADVLHGHEWSDHKRVWLVQGLNSYRAVDPASVIKRCMDDHWQQLETRRFRGVGEVVLYSLVPSRDGQ